VRSDHLTAPSSARWEAEARGKRAQKKEKTAGEEGEGVKEGEGEIREWERRRMGVMDGEEVKREDGK
jgi:hypothetical protein